MKRYLSLLLAAFLFTAQGYAELAPPIGFQRQRPIPAKINKGLDPQRMTYGGNFGASFGTLTYVDISPLVGYKITDEFIAGIGASYIFYRQRYTPTMTYQTHLYGGRIFSQYNFLPQVFVHGEMEMLNYDYYDFLTGKNDRTWYATPLAGLGYAQAVGARSSFRVMALYAFKSDDPRSPYYNNPLVFRVGFLF